MVIALFALTLTLPSCLFLEEIEIQLSGANTGPYVTSWENLEEIQRLISDENHPGLISARRLLVKRADDWLNQEPFSVTYSIEPKSDLSPGSDAHDYVSLATYAHPDPDSQNGLPFIEIGNVRNPDVDLFDRVPLANLSKAIDDLSLAYYYTGNEIYAEKAAEFIKTWFLNEETRMNPHLKYSQIWPGISDGASQGIVESRDFIPVIEGASLIYASDYWNEEDHKALKLWFHEFLEWITRNYGPGAYETSNIGTWLDSQKIIYALFTEQEHLLQFDNFIRPHQERQNIQITLDGSQPFEENRGNNKQHYTYFNLKGHIIQAELRRHVKKESDETLTPSVIGITRLQNALDWLLPDQTGIWRYNQDFNTCRYIELYLPASRSFNNPSYYSVVDRLLKDKGCYDIQTLLTHPPLKQESGS